MGEYRVTSLGEGFLQLGIGSNFEIPEGNININNLQYQKLSPGLVRSSRQEVFCDKVAGLKLATLSRKRLQHRYFPMNFAKFLRAPFFIEHLRWPLLACKLKLFK